MLALLAVTPSGVAANPSKPLLLRLTWHRVANGVSFVFASGPRALLISSTSTTDRALIDDRTGRQVNPTKPGCAAFDTMGIVGNGIVRPS